MLKDVDDGCELMVFVQPRSSRNRCVGEFNGMLKIQLTAPPVDGAANDALVQFLATELAVARRVIEILSGQSGRKKCLHVKGLHASEALQRLNLK